MSTEKSVNDRIKQEKATTVSQLFCQYRTRSIASTLSPYHIHEIIVPNMPLTLTQLNQAVNNKALHFHQVEPSFRHFFEQEYLSSSQIPCSYC